MLSCSWWLFISTTPAPARCVVLVQHLHAVVLNQICTRRLDLNTFCHFFTGTLGQVCACGRPRSPSRVRPMHNHHFRHLLTSEEHKRHRILQRWTLRR